MKQIKLVGTGKLHIRKGKKISVSEGDAEILQAKGAAQTIEAFKQASEEQIAAAEKTDTLELGSDETLDEFKEKVKSAEGNEKKEISKPAGKKDIKKPGN